MEAERPELIEQILDLDLRVERPADWRVLVAAAAVAAWTDLAFRAGVAGIAGTLLVVVVSAGMLSSGRIINPPARALVAAAPLFGVWLTLRQSVWLLPLDLLAVAGLLALGASLARGGSVLDLSIPRLLSRAVAGAAHGLAGPGFAIRPLGRPLSERAGSGRVVARGALLAVPLLFLLGVLLASSDAVFAGFFRLHVNGPDLVLHSVALGFGAWAVSGLLRLASATRTEALRPVAVRVSASEAIVVLAGMVTLFAGFAVAQIVALSGAGHRIIQTAGLTYAEYARSGFFQLLAVAAITLGVLLALRATVVLETARARGWFLGLAGAAVALTVVILVVSLRRLALYERVFGLTMLRLYAGVFAILLAVVFLMLALRISGVGARRHWFLPAALGAALATVLMLNAINPEALVVSRDVANAERTGRFDAGYLSQLSDDAVPTVVRLLPHLAPPQRAAALAVLCARPSWPFTGWAAYNTSQEAAHAALVRACPARFGSRG
jgi:hypothetical protein